MENTESNLPGLLGLVVFALFIAIFYAGAAKKVVIYYDYKDLFISIGALFTPFYFSPYGKRNLLNRNLQKYLFPGLPLPY